MIDYPVHFHCKPSGAFTRLQLLLRILGLVVLGAAGFSLGGLFGLLFVGLPIVSAIRISGLGTRKDYVASDGARILFLLRWTTAITSWFGLACERLPARDAEETVSLTVDEVSHEDRSSTLSPAGAAARILSGLPSLLGLCLLSLFGSLVWLWAAVCVLFAEQVPGSAGRFLEGLQRYSARLLVYQAGLVDTYPPFALSEAPGTPPTNDPPRTPEDRLATRGEPG